MNKEPSTSSSNPLTLRSFTFTPETYEKKYSKQSLGVFALLCNLAKINDSTRSILETGCGPGIGTQYLSYITKAPCFIYAQDLTESMITFAETNLQSNPEIINNKNNLLEVITPKTALNITRDNEELMAKCKNCGKVIKIFEGNCENLLFDDNQFDVYISCLTLMMCNWEKALTEAYRVLKPDARFAISIWGKQEQSIAFYLAEDVLKKYNIDSKVFELYNMGQNTEILIEKLEAIGFHDIKMDYTNLFRAPIDWDETEYFLQSYDIVVDKAVNNIAKEQNDPSLRDKIMNEIKDEIHKKLTIEKVIPQCNILCITGAKKAKLSN